MARPRTPKAKAEITGYADKQKTKFKGRNEPFVADDLGDAPAWLKDTDTSKPRMAWEILRSEIPWLNSSHRMLVATLCNQLGRLVAGQEVGVQASVFIKQCLGAMGATPADASKAGAKPDGERKDPADEFFND
ncbi:hypothetical protein GOB02_18915 [Sinorhizobium meliloti]|nr:hypothetical protein [Sinorhizobium meliloti]